MTASSRATEFEQLNEAEDAAAPDWAAFDGDLPCPCCGYNLRELTVNRCPECGGHFNWSEEIEKARRGECKLFEVQFPTDCVRSFFRTVAWLLRPWHFWSHVPVLRPTRLLPLFVQFLLTLIACGLLQLANHFFWKWAFIIRFGRYGGNYQPGPLYYVQWYIWYSIPIFVFSAVVWLVMLVFWQTRRTHQIRQRQALRVHAYPLIAMLLTGVLTYVAIDIMQHLAMLIRWRPAWLYEIQYAPSCVGLSVYFVALARGLRVQLGIQRSLRLTAVVFALTVIVIDFAIIQSGLICGTFEPYENPIVSMFFSYVPSFWLLLIACPSG